jgi:hypothetical protein
LPQLNLIFVWAKKAGLVRARGKRLMQAVEAKPLVADADAGAGSRADVDVALGAGALALWQRAFDAFFELRDVVCVPIWADEGPSMLHEVYAEAVPEVLNTIYSLPYPMPMVRLEESVWQSCRRQFSIDGASFLQQEGWRGRAGNDLVQVFDALAALGAVEKTRGLADEMFIADLADDYEMPIPGERPITGETAARLREKLARPGDLVALTALGTQAMRRRLLAEGREAGLVGDLAGADPAGLLGVLSQHYTPQTGEAEIAGWLAGHGGDIEPLLDAVRACPFRSRAAAMLSVLDAATPDWTALLHRLRGDPVLAPLAVTVLLDEGVLRPDELTEREHGLVMTEGFLRLLEVGGPDAVSALLDGMPGTDREDLLELMRSCGHPGEPTLQDFEALVV